MKLAIVMGAIKLLSAVLLPVLWYCCQANTLGINMLFIGWWSFQWSLLCRSTKGVTEDHDSNSPLILLLTQELQDLPELSKFVATQLSIPPPPKKKKNHSVLHERPYILNCNSFSSLTAQGYGRFHPSRGYSWEFKEKEEKGLMSFVLLTEL